MEQFPRLCWVLLDYAEDTHRHYYHLYHFVERVAARIPVRVLFLHATSHPRLANVESVHVLPPGNPCVRQRALRAILRRAHADGFRIFYCHYAYAAARIAGNLTRKGGGRTFLWHCIQVHHLDRVTGASLRQKIMWRMTLRAIHHLVTGSSAMAEYYRRQFGLRADKVVVVPNYINLDRFPPMASQRAALRQQLGLPADAEVILYLHEMEEGRCRRLPEIVDGVLSRRPRSRFLLVGDGRYRAELERRVRELNWGERAAFLGRVPNQDVSRYFGAADVYLVTSEFEAFSRVHLEAMAMGIPFVSTDGGGPILAYTPPEAREFVVPVGEIGRFPELIGRILDSPDVAERLRAAGLRKVQEFSEEAVLPVFLEQICGVNRP
jgi:glycosyltransferase involved in cell wall biosynthesis